MMQEGGNYHDKIGFAHHTNSLGLSLRQTPPQEKNKVRQRAPQLILYPTHLIQQEVM